MVAVEAVAIEWFQGLVTVDLWQHGQSLSFFSPEDGQCLVTLHVILSPGPPFPTFLCPVLCLGR